MSAQHSDYPEIREESMNDKSWHEHPKDGTEDTPNEEILCSSIVEAWAFLPVELQRSIVTIVEQHLQLSLGRSRPLRANQQLRE